MNMIKNRELKRKSRVQLFKKLLEKAAGAHCRDVTLLRLSRKGLFCASLLVHLV